MRLRIIQILLLTFLIFGCTKQLLIKDYFKVEESYQMFGRIPERDFYYPVNLTDSLELIWESGTHGSLGMNSVVIEDNYLFVGDLAGRLYCFNADSGKTVGADKGSGEVPVTPILNAGFVYYINTISEENYSHIIKYSIRNGVRDKEVKIPGRVGNELIKFDDGIFLVSDEGKAVYYDLYLQEKWEVELGDNVYTSPAANNSAIYICTYNGELISLRKKDGTEILRKQFPDKFESAIVIKNESGFAGTLQGSFISFDLKSGEELWRSETGSKIVAPAAANTEYIYVSNLGGAINCWNINTGEHIWKFASDGIFNTAPALFNNTLMQPDLFERMLFINPSNGEISKTWDFEDRLKFHPVYFQGKLYIGKDRGDVLAYKLHQEFE